MEDNAPLSGISLNESDQRSLTEDLRQLADDARTLAEAELAYQKSRAAFAGNEAKHIAVLGAVVATFAVLAVMAFVLGTVIALGPVLGPWGATAAVTGALLLIAVLCTLVILWRVRRMKRVLSDRTDS